MRRSLLDEKKDHPRNQQIKNYKSNQELEFYKTVPTYVENEHKNASSLEIIDTEIILKRPYDRSGTEGPEDHFIETDSFKSSNYNFPSKEDCKNRKTCENRLSSLENPKYDTKFNIGLSKGIEKLTMKQKYETARNKGVIMMLDQVNNNHNTFGKKRSSKPKNIDHKEYPAHEFEMDVSQSQKHCIHG
eukprot:CAMPEP_0197001820 /NCGR_PEP_ID=MMETSP1380-20130617/6438_1 /TAXON_ID=5936 /ORGANISM="Euplotes crassus, Strain CT5" /LENGTH=187 /DNA_ID=CAMNT_0042419651 /DNA_START=258 /DNA_END=821 /DNA_ORIENTATION=-